MSWYTDNPLIWPMAVVGGDQQDVLLHEFYIEALLGQVVAEDLLLDGPLDVLPAHLALGVGVGPVMGFAHQVGHFRKPGGDLEHSVRLAGRKNKLTAPVFGSVRENCWANTHAQGRSSREHVVRIQEKIFRLAGNNIGARSTRLSPCTLARLLCLRQALGMTCGRRPLSSTSEAKPGASA